MQPSEVQLAVRPQRKQKKKNGKTSSVALPSGTARTHLPVDRPSVPRAFSILDDSDRSLPCPDFPPVPSGESVTATELAGLSLQHVLVGALVTICYRLGRCWRLSCRDGGGFFWRRVDNKQPSCLVALDFGCEPPLSSFSLYSGHAPDCKLAGYTEADLGSNPL